MKVRISAFHPAFRWLRRRTKFRRVLQLGLGLVGILGLAISACTSPSMRGSAGGSTTTTVALSLRAASNAAPDDTRRSAATTWVIAAAGDIACDPGSASFRRLRGAVDACHMDATAGLLRKLDPVSECANVGGCGKGSRQERWLRADLAAHPSACTLAYWHKPRFSSGLHGDDPTYAALRQALYAAGADVVLVGHDHDYERFALQRPDAVADTARGIREFVVGTGGKTHYGFRTIRRNSQLRNTGTFGVLRLALHPNGYDWRFLPEPASTSPTRATAPATDESSREGSVEIQRSRVGSAGRRSR